MAAADSVKTLNEQYLLEEKNEKPDLGTNQEVESDVKDPIKAASEVAVTENAEEASVTTGTDETAPLPVENTDATPEVTTDTDKDVTPAPSDVSEESPDSAENQNSDDQEANEETPEIKLETAPSDFRFPTTNQSRHCFTRYIEYHRCVAAKGEGAPECDKFAKYYRSLCPGEWVDRWNEQRENGTFPGPL